MPSNTEGNIILDPSLRLKQLSAVGGNVVVDNSVPVERYLRSGPQMEKMARTYYAEGQLEQAFILYNRFATLFVEKLPKHPGYSKASPADRSRIKKLLKPAFERAMELKEKLRVMYDQEKVTYVQEKKREEEETMQVKKEEEETKKMMQQQNTTHDLPPVQSTPNEPPPSDTPPNSEPPITHNEGDIPSNEDDRVGESPRIEIQGLGEEEGDPEYSWTPCDDALLLSNIQTYFDDDYEEDPVVEAQSDLTATNNDLSKVLPDGPSKPTALVVPPAQQRLSQPLTTHPPNSALPQQSPALPPPVGYTPTHPPHSALPPPAGYTPTHPPPYSPHPPSPYQYSVDPSWHDSYMRSSSYPVMQVVVPDQAQLPPPSTPPAMSSRTPTIDRTCKPMDHDKLHVLTSLGGIGGGIRPVIIPNDTPSRFLTVASGNTRKNIETCGILGGKLVQNKFRISHIIIPKQSGKADSCETLNEEEIFGVQDKYDLITLGWIHTHPSQTSFMSSVDLHTHCSYQLMLEEAIAIVCAPKFNQVGVFSLTQPHGLKYISGCCGKGFHTHPKEPPLYEDCPHVQYDGSISVDIIDLR